MSTSMFNSEVELSKFLGSIDVIPCAFRAISETNMAYELHTSPSGIKVLAFDCPTDYTTPFLNGEFDLVSSENNKVVDFISTKSNSKFCINKAAVKMFENLSDDLKELEKKHINTPLVITGSGLGGYLAILSALQLHQAVDVEGSNGSMRTKRPICITFGCPLLGDIALQRAISERPLWKSSFLNVVAKKDPVPSFLSSSGLYKPFGTYLFCTESGGYATFEDQDLILAVLQELASLSFGSMEMHNYDNDLISIKKKVLYRGGASELGEFNFNFLRAGLTLQLLEVDMLENISTSLLEKMEARQANKIRSKKNIYSPTKKLNEMKMSLTFIEWYMITRRSKGGYYNCYKNAVTRDEIETQQRITSHQMFLNQYWKKTAEEKDLMPQKEGAKMRKRWLLGGTNYRRIVEPLDIADFYRKGRKNYIENRPNHYKLLEKWSDEDKKDSNPSGQTNMTTDLIHDSCFWAYVEEAVISLRDLKKGGSSNSESDIAQGLKSFEANVRRALTVVRSRWIDS